MKTLNRTELELKILELLKEDVDTAMGLHIAVDIKGNVTLHEFGSQYNFTSDCDSTVFNQTIVYPDNEDMEDVSDLDMINIYLDNLDFDDVFIEYLKSLTKFMEIRNSPLIQHDVAEAFNENKYKTMSFNQIQDEWMSNNI